MIMMLLTSLQCNRNANITVADAEDNSRKKLRSYQAVQPSMKQPTKKREGSCDQQRYNTY